MRRSSITRTLCLASLLAVYIVNAPPISVAQSEPRNHIPETECRLEMTLPPESAVTIDGKDYGAEATNVRSFTLRNVVPDALRRIAVIVRFRDGATSNRVILAKGGNVVRLLLPNPNAARPELILQTGHTRDVNAAGFSPDGKQVLTGSDDHTAILWDAASGAKLRVFAGHTDRVRCVAFSPDGKRVLTGCGDNTAILWDAASGEKLRSFEEHFSTVAPVTFSPDGKHVLTGSWDGTAILWDAASGEKLRPFKGHTDAVESVAFSPDGKHVLTGSGDDTAILWDASSGENVRTFEGHNSRVVSVTFSPNGEHVLTGSWDDTAILWGTSSGEKQRVFEGHADNVNSVAFGPNGRHVLTGSDDRTAILWDAASGEELRSLKGHSSTVTSVAFSPDGKQVLTGSWDNTAILWDAASGEKLRAFEGDDCYGTSVAFGPHGKQVLTGEGAVLWDAASGQKLQSFKGHFSAVTSMAFSPNGKRVLTGFGNDTAILWNAVSGETLRSFEGHTGAVNSVAFAPNGRRVLTGSDDHTAILWDAASGKKLRLFKGHTKRVTSVAFSADGSYVLTGSDDHSAILWYAGWRYRTWGDKECSFDGHTERVTSVAFSPDGKQALTGSRDNTAILWDATFGKKLRSFEGHTEDVESVAFSPEGKQVLTGSSDNTAILWDAASGKQLRSFRGHTSSVASATFSTDGKQVLTGSRDGTVRLWDVLTGDQLLQILSLDGGQDWLAVTREGLFDGSPGGRQKVSFRVGCGLKVVPVDRFRNDFYRPGLMADIWRGERPMPDVDIGGSRPPLLRIVSPQSGDSKDREVEVVVEATDQGGGISDARLFHNGAFVGGSLVNEVTANGKLTQTYRLSLVEGINEIRFTAFSGDRSWEAEPAEIRLHYAKPLPPSEVHVLCVGVDKYADPDLNLRYASRDASAFAKLFGGPRTASLYAQTHVEDLLNERATKARVLSSLGSMAANTREQDTLVVLLAGHGEVVGDCYYFVPHDFRPRGEKVEDDVKAQGVKDEEIFEYLGNARARKRILMLATCHAGAALQLPYKRRRGMADRRRQERLVRSYGVYALGAASADKEAHESDEIRHGLFAYTLLAGLNAVDQGPLAGKPIQPSDPGGIVDVSEWVEYLSRNMPELSEHLFNFQQYPVCNGEGNFALLPLGD